MKRNKAANVISVGAICSALSVLFQLAPLYFPGFGIMLSPLSSLPIIFAAYYSISCGSLTYVCAGILILLLSPHESIIFMLTTGIFGLTLGLTYYKKPIISIILPGLVLYLGIIILTYLIGIAAFGDVLSNWPTYIVLLITFIFSFVYSCIWTVIIKIIIHRFKGLTPRSRR